MRRYKPTAQKKYGMTRIGIFGSVARGEQTDDSDVDVCYEGEAPSLLTLDKIQVELEQLLGCRVDLVRVRDNMNSLLRKRILSEGIYVDVVFRTLEDIPAMKPVVERMIKDLS